MAEANTPNAELLAAMLDELRNLRAEVKAFRRENRVNTMRVVDRVVENTDAVRAEAGLP